MAGIMNASIRKIQIEDNSSVAQIIKTVMPEFGANLPGFAIHDPEVQNMFEAYDKPGSSYFVCEINGQIVGGAGIAPLLNGEDDTCELQKMYFLADARGKGFGKQLLKLCLAEARKFGYRKCYIETFHTMSTAISLYEKNGFQPIQRSLGNTGHFGCDTFYILDL
jgi:putative acetyltransferase